MCDVKVAKQKTKQLTSSRFSVAGLPVALAFGATRVETTLGAAFGAVTVTVAALAAGNSNFATSSPAASSFLAGLAEFDAKERFESSSDRKPSPRSRLLRD